MTAAKPPLTYRDAESTSTPATPLSIASNPLVKRSFRPGSWAGWADSAPCSTCPASTADRFWYPARGVGTKLKLAQQWQRHDSIGIDLVGMCVNDVLVQGAEPLFFLDDFATGKLDVDTTAQVVGGIAEGCVRAGCALIGGETAEMPDMYGVGEYDLAGFCVAAVEKSKLLDGSAVRAGDVLLGIDSSGPHSNGYSLIRRVLERSGAAPDLMLDGTRLDDALMAPTTIYVKPILALLAAHAPHAMAHITGGGLEENIIRVVPDGLGIEIDASSWTLPPVFDWLQREGAISDREMWRTFNCGIGFVVITTADESSAIQQLLATQGLTSRPIGRVVTASADQRVRIG